MEPSKVILEKVWRIYEVPDPGKGQMQSLSLKTGTIEDQRN